ncbi:MAG: hypothetical protein JO111_15480 [Caulobacteraceae bacterium]|nr:hypothetical protein [Caulobacteraceae bacterium]
MNGLARAFSEHPRSVGESYFEHLETAMNFSGALAAAALACFVHAFLPFLFVTTGSRQIRRIHDAMVTHRGRVGGEQIHHQDTKDTKLEFSAFGAGAGI